ncbi:hypothetical protein Sa4125_27470 [Aureimonas sp. SA4125]|uniref:hypothetical protein n=1 Tax=Aureimonas sp. SA4125 TaxID=2826993 RepID=UPI001CC69046|nr:hypothetical protein [Aureimonas sp. SA4125]BDA85205.1 hypothetical protein Sa4125_27470 [Aureimonas sp. SA4125]
MIDGMSFLERSLIVAAHPDDEMLWFNSIIGKVDHAVIVYRNFWAAPELGLARAAAIGALPLKKVTCLDIDEAGTYGCADWSNPVLTEHGLEFGGAETRREIKRVTKRSIGRILPVTAATAPERVSAQYAENFQRICDVLEPMLSPDMNVFTHNPWGEYGHEDHIQVFRALDRLRDKIGFRLWMSNYCTERALPLAMRYFVKAPGPYIRLPTDKILADRIADVYRAHGCWTWADDWSWFDEECFMEAPRGESGGKQRHLFPLNFFSIEDHRQPSPSHMATVATLLMSGMVGAAIAEAM